MNNKKTIRSAVKRKFPAIGIDDTLETALNVMAQANASALIVKVGEELIGVITITDIMYSLSNEDDLQDTRGSSFMTKCEFISKKAIRNPCVQLDEDEDNLCIAGRKTVGRLFNLRRGSPTIFCVSK